MCASKIGASRARNRVRLLLHTRPVSAEWEGAEARAAALVSICGCVGFRAADSRHSIVDRSVARVHRVQTSRGDQQRCGENRRDPIELACACNVHWRATCSTQATTCIEWQPSGRAGARLRVGSRARIRQRSQAPATCEGSTTEHECREHAMGWIGASWHRSINPNCAVSVEGFTAQLGVAGR
jgi:hypothetical protein